MTALDRLNHRATIATKRIALVGFTGLVVIALLTFYDGAARYLDLPRVSGFSDFGELLFPIIIASCFPALLIQQKNLTIRVLARVTGDGAARWADLAAAVAVLIFFTLLGLQSKNKLRQRCVPGVPFEVVTIIISMIVIIVTTGAFRFS